MDRMSLEMRMSFYKPKLIQKIVMDYLETKKKMMMAMEDMKVVNIEIFEINTTLLTEFMHLNKWVQ